MRCGTQWPLGLLHRPSGGEIGPGIRYLAVALVSLAVGTSSLTFSWVIEHRTQSNVFPEFAGRVVYLSDVLLFFGLGLWAVGRQLSTRQALRYGPWYVSVPVLVLVCLTALSTLWAVDGSQAGYTTIRQFLLLGLYVVLATESTKATVPMAAALLGIGALQAGVAMAQVALGSPVGLSSLGELREGALGYGSIGSRAYGLGFNPNPVGLFLAVASLAAYGAYLHGASGRWLRGLLLGFFVVAFIGLAATGSRSALLGWSFGLLVTSLLVWFDGGRARTVRIRRVGLALLAVALLPTFVQLAPTIKDRPGIGDFNTGLERFTPSQLSNDLGTRLNDYRLSLPLVQENLVLGVGAGNYALALKEALSPDTVGGSYVPVHNVPLLVLAELGILGGNAWALLMVAPVIWIASRRRAGFGLYGLLWIGPLVAILFVSLLDFPPWATQDGRLLFWGVLGLWSGGVGVKGGQTAATEASAKEDNRVS